MLIDFPRQVLLLIPCIPILALVNNVSAQEQKCAKTLAWKDATHLQRVTKNRDVDAKAEWKLFRNGILIQLQIDGKTSKLLSLPNSIELTYGNGRPRPIEFAEIEMAVESPMWGAGNANLIRFPTPCKLANGENLPINERDFIQWKEGTEHSQLKIFGSLRRQGLAVKYAIEIKRRANEDQAETLYGLWEYQAELATLPKDFDLQGWHVFKDGEYLKTISEGRVYSLSDFFVDFKL